MADGFGSVLKLLNTPVIRGTRSTIGVGTRDTRPTEHPSRDYLPPRSSFGPMTGTDSDGADSFMRLRRTASLRLD